jgi:hypothetical protein
MARRQANPPNQRSDYLPLSVIDLLPHQRQHHVGK